MTAKVKLSILALLLISSVFAEIIPQADPDVEADFPEPEPQDFEPIIIDVNEQKIGTGRSLIGYPKLRIATDFEHLTAGTDEWKTYFKTQLVPAIVDYFKATFKSKGPVLDPIKSTAKTLCGFPTPQSIQDGIKGDMVIFFNSRSDASGWVAATTLCALSSSKKPLIVNIGINTNAMSSVATPDKNPLTHDLNIITISHEFIHALGMNGVLYKYFVDSNGNFLTDHIKRVEMAGQNRTVLDLPGLTQRLRTFYGCATLPGVMMEDDGGAHLERRYFPYEVMSTGAIQSTKISEVSIGFLEGTGWYVADYSYAEPYPVGKGQGCDFIYGDCDANVFDDYCSGTGRGCNNVGLSGAYCKSDSKSESCRYYVSQPEFNCENPSGVYYTTMSSKQVFGRGLGSKCFAGNLTTSKTATVSQTSYCFTYTCQGEGLSTILQVNFGTTVVTCNQKGPLSISGYNGFLDCPDPITYCATIGKPSCIRNCSGRGTCTNGVCKCNAGYTGTDCGFVSS